MHIVLFFNIIKLVEFSPCVSTDLIVISMVRELIQINVVSVLGEQVLKVLGGG